MSIRKRIWTTSSGEKREAWIVDYADQSGVRRLKTFDRKKDADAFDTTAKGEIRQGVHVADSASITVEAAGELWIETSNAAELERATVVNYRQHLDLHITPFIGQDLLSRLTVPSIRAFMDELRKAKRSAAMVKKVIGALGALLADAQERGLVARNVVRDMRSHRKRGKERQAERRQKGRPQIGVDIPTREEVKRIIDNLSGRWRPILITAIFCGLRASELRGLRWQDIDLDARALHVRQRADRFNAIGRPKSEAGERTVPLPPLAVNGLREWKLACPKRTTRRKNQSGEYIKELHLVFPNTLGNVETHAKIVNRGLIPTQIAAGVTVDTGEVDEDGDHPILAAKYTGLHSLRHFFASWCINRPQDGGLGLPPKMVQERMGHSSISQTMDTYGHLFPRGDDADELAKAERMLLA